MKILTNSVVIEFFQIINFKMKNINRIIMSIFVFFKNYGVPQEAMEV